MSLVAFLHNYGYPLLVGDLLVSRPPLPNEPITAQTLPTGKREIAGIGGTKLRRKLYIINDRLAAGVVGEINTGGAFVRALKARFAAGSPDAGEVTNFVRAHVEALNDPTRLNAIVIHAGAETNGQIPFSVGKCNLGVREETTRYAGEIIAIGSGMNEFVEYAQRAVPLGDSKDLRSALGRILSLLAGLLIDEAGGVRDLSSAWGAGFELLAFDQGRFQRFDSVTYVAWQLTDEDIFMPAYIVKYYYDEQGRLIACPLRDGLPDPSGAIGLDEDPRAPWQIPPPDLTSDVMCHVYLATRNGRTHMIPTVLTRADIAVQFAIVNDKYQIAQSTEWAKGIRQRFKALFSADAAKR